MTKENKMRREREMEERTEEGEGEEMTEKKENRKEKWCKGNGKGEKESGLK